MDYKKLSDAIRLCGSTPKINECKEKCPYYAGGDMMKCIPVMTKDAADAIEKLSGLLRYEYKGYYTSPHWDYYDGVKNASTEFDQKINRMCVRVCFDRSGNDDIVFPVNEEAYLMNDNGKTIEKFYGPVQLDRNLKAVKEMGAEEVRND